jgi:AcrR family transcriptional regulator
MITDPREHLVATAREAFLSRGFNGVSTAEIAADSGRSKKTLFKHFPSKTELLRAVLADAARQVADRALVTTAQRGAEAPAGIAAFFLEAGLHLARLQSHLIADLEATDPRLAASILHEQRADLGVLMGRVLEHGADLGLIDRRRDLAGTVATFIATCEGLGRQADEAAAGHVRRSAAWMLSALKA